MKVDPISWNVPGTKYCVHENGMTAVVSETDSVYLYSNKPLRMLAFNPKSGLTIYADENGAVREFFARDMQEAGVLKEAKQIYEKGLQLLAAAHYSLPQSEEKKIYEWLQHLWNRPSIGSEELRAGPGLVASLYMHPRGPNPRMVAQCYMLGDFDRAYGSRLLFKIRQDPDLNSVIQVHEQNNHDVKVISSNAQGYSIECSPNVVRITREEARWLRELLPPIPAKRYLNIHKTILAAGENKIKQREKAILRGVSRFGTVAI